MHGGFVPVELDNTMSHQVVEVRREAVAPCITCPLCHKLFRDATTITECLHTFCRKCIYTKLSNEEIECCPICNIKLGCVSLEKLRPDHNLQHVRANIFPQERIKVKAPEEVTLVVALPAKRKERSLSSLVASNKLDGDALPLPQISASYLKKKCHQPGLGGDKTKSAPAPISPLPSKVGKKDFSSSKGGKKYNLLPKDGKKDTTLSLSKKRSVPASAETAAAKKGKPSSPVMSPAALESESAPVSVNSGMPPAAAPSGLPTSSVPALTGSEAQTPKVGIRAGSASHVSLLDMSPTSCYDFVRSFATEKDKAQLQGLSRREKQIALSYNMVQVLAFLSYSFEEETLVETKSKELAEANAKQQDSVAAHELLRDRIAIVEHDNNNLKTTIGNLQNQLKDSASAHEREKALLRDRIAIFEQDNNNLKSTIGNLQNQLKNSAAAHELDKALLGDRIAIFEQGKNNFKSTIGNLQNQLKDSAAAHERQVADLNKQMHQLQEQVETPAGTTSAEAPPGPTPAPNADSVAPTTVYFAAEQSEDTVIDLDNFFDIVGTAAERSDEETDDIYIADFGFIMEDYGTGMR